MLLTAQREINHSEGHRFRRHASEQLSNAQNVHLHQGHLGENIHMLEQLRQQPVKRMAEAHPHFEHVKLDNLVFDITEYNRVEGGLRKLFLVEFVVGNVHTARISWTSA